MDNKPIAVYYNYAMHAVAAGQLDMISGDVPGTTSKYIEDTFDNEIIAVWSTGASGDQNPITSIRRMSYEISVLRNMQKEAKISQMQCLQEAQGLTGTTLK